MVAQVELFDGSEPSGRIDDLRGYQGVGSVSDGSTFEEFSRLWIPIDPSRSPSKLVVQLRDLRGDSEPVGVELDVGAFGGEGR